MKPLTRVGQTNQLTFFAGAAAFLAAGFLALVVVEEAVFLGAAACNWGRRHRLLTIERPLNTLWHVSALTFFVAVAVLGLVVFALVEVPVAAFLGSAAFLVAVAALGLAAAADLSALGASLTLPETPLGRTRALVSAPRWMALLMCLLKAASEILLVSGCFAWMNFLMVGRPSP